VVAAITPEKPPVERPSAETPVAKKPAAAGDAGVLEAVNAWAKAWSAKDVDAYLASYAKDFQPPRGESRDDWAKGRRQRVSAPKSISVTIESPKVSVTGGQASVTFRQGYRSDIVRSTSTKTLILVKSEGRWLIQQEKVN
jgi:ketosteroid isomerase-like protein